MMNLSICQLKVAISSLSELWNLMDTSESERMYFLRLASVLGCSDDDITQRDALSMDVIDQVRIYLLLFVLVIERIAT